MIRYAVQHVLQALVVLIAVLTVVFLLERVAGNPAVLYAPLGATSAQKLEISRSLGLQEPLPLQYLTFLAHAARGDFGESFVYNASVQGLLLHAFPYSAGLGLAAFLFATVLGITLGTISALNSGTWVDLLSKGITLVGQSVPSFWLGELLVIVFAVKFRLLPAFGPGTLQHVILPAVALGALPLASVARLTRSAVLDVMRADHMLFERSKGVSQVIFLSHLARNASLPVVTFSGIQLGSLLSGSVVIEVLFAWPGLGLLAIQAINQRDYPVIEGTVLVETAIFVILNLLVDLTYGWLDPRITRD